MRVLLADDQPEIRSALRLLLEQEPEFVVVGEAATADDLLAQTGAYDPDVVMLDWELPDKDDSRKPGAAARQQLIASLRALSPGLKVIALSGRLEARKAAFAAGADGFVSKGDPPEHLLSALREVMATIDKPPI